MDERDSFKSSLKDHFDKKLVRLASLEKDLDKKSSELDESEDTIRGLRNKEQELNQTVRKLEMTIQKMRLVTGSCQIKCPSFLQTLFKGFVLTYL